MFAAFVFILALKVEEKTKKIKILIHKVQHLVKKSFSSRQENEREEITEETENFPVKERHKLTD